MLESKKLRDVVSNAKYHFLLSFEPHDPLHERKYLFPQLNLLLVNESVNENFKARTRKQR